MSNRGYNPASIFSGFSSRGKTLIRSKGLLSTKLAWVLAAAPVAGLGTSSPAATVPASSSSTAAVSSTASVPGGALRAISQDLRGATFEYIPGEVRFDSTNVGGTAYSRVSVRGAVVAEAPGKPALPTATLHVAVPEGMSPRLRVTAEEWGERAGPPPPVPVARQRFVSDEPGKGPVSEVTVEPDPQFYARSAVYPAAAVLGRGAAVGEMWVVPVQIRPVLWDAGGAEYRILRRMTLRVEFVPATDRERAERPAFRPGGDSGAWRRVQEGLIQNYESARSFPIRGKIAPVPRRSAGLRGAVNPEFKISVTTTGWVSVGYSALSGTGFPGGIAINTITVSERGYDDVGDSVTTTVIPVVARDNNSNGTFDTGDAITFYARSLRDRVGPGSIENRYADANVYWLTWAGSPAAMPDTIAGDIPGPAATPGSFYDTIHMEQNAFMLAVPAMNVASPPEAVDHFFWTNGFGSDVFDQPIPFVDPDASRPFRIRSWYQGLTGSLHRLNIHFVSSTGLTDTLASNEVFLNQEVYVLDTGFNIPGSRIGAGPNRYRHVGDRQVSSSFIPGSGSMLDWIDVTYARLYLARNDMIRFTSGETNAVTEIQVTGFTSGNIEIYDVTVPTAPERVTGVAITPSGPTFEVMFRTDATAGERAFVALVPGAETAVGASGVVPDAPSALMVPGAFASNSIARSILIAPEAFLAPVNRLAEHRRAQGYVVEVAGIQDVYDEFNGGIKSAQAIRRYVRHAYLTWTPRPMFVLLAGDGSMDYKHYLAGSGADWVPTYLKFETIPGPQGFELVAHDSHYSLNLNVPVPGENDYVPNVFLSRLPAGSAAQLDQFVTKAIAYEGFQPTDAWRGRMLLLSDDEYSSTIYFAGGYCFQPVEAEFHSTNIQMKGTAENSLGGRDLQSEFFELRTYSDALASACQSPGNCRDLLCIFNGFRTIGGAVDQFHARLTQGALILNAQAHANRYLIAHERIYETQFGDLTRIQNVGRPVLFMVWGCHASQFPDGPFGTGGIDSTDAIGEEWLLLPDRGSIGSLGSSAYEYLSTNAVYNLYVAEAFFTTPPTPAPPPGEPQRSRWILGEVIGAAAIRNGMNGFNPTQAVMNRTIHLLADPMLRMDALPPRVFEVQLNGTQVAEGAPFTTDSPTDSLTLVAKAREETSIRTLDLAERDLASGNVTPVSTPYTVVFSDSARLATLTGAVRPRVGNYDLQIRATDTNDRQQTFTLQVRTPVRYFANGVEIVNGVFVQSDARLRAEVTTPIPVTAESLALHLDGMPLVITKTQTDAAGRQWALETLPESHGPGTHTLQIAIGGRTAGFAQVTFQVSAEFTMRGVAVVSPKVQGAGCGGSVFQYELSAPASKVELLLLTVSGRRVGSLSLPGDAGLNVYCWDGRDSRGHETATGLYLYRLRATDPSGRTISRDGRMIRSR